MTWSLRRVKLIPSDLKLFVLETPWAHFELHIIPYARPRVLTPEEEVERHIGAWKPFDDDLRVT